MEESQSDDVYLTAALGGTATIGGQQHNGGTTGSAIVIKHDQSGVTQWSRSFPTLSSGGTYAVAGGIGADAQLVFVGGYDGDVDMGDQTLTHQTQYDGFVAKLQP